MPSLSRILLAIGLFAALSAGSTLTAQVASQKHTGLTYSVSTSGYQFTPTIGSLVPPAKTAGSAAAAAPPAANPQGFVASVTLANHTSSAIDFVLIGLSNHNFHFQVYNSDNVLVWNPYAGMAQPDIAIALPLKAGSAWHATQFVPIFVNGAPLPAGTYTLDVTLAGSPQFRSTTSFVVNPAIAIN